MKPANAKDDEWQFLLSFLRASNSSVVITDAKKDDHPIIFVNAAFERTTGYTADEIVGLNCRVLQGDDRDQPERLKIQQSLANEVACECLLRNYRKNGQMFWNQLFLFPFKNKGETVCFVGIQSDVTRERKMLEKLQATSVERAQLIETLNSSKVRMARLSLELLNAQEAERKAVARELHDELGQRLSALNMLLHRAHPHFAATGVSDLWNQAKHQITGLVGLVRDISASLRPPGLDLFGLEESVRKLLTRHLQNGPSWVFEYAGLPKRLTPAIEISVFRIVQESITNIMRHSRANHVVVEVNGGVNMEELELIVRDDGVGFDSSSWPERSAREGRMGLIGMSERVALLGGTFSVNSLPGSGTRITATIPLGAADGFIA